MDWQRPQPPTASAEPGRALGLLLWLRYVLPFRCKMVIDTLHMLTFECNAAPGLPAAITCSLAQGLTSPALFALIFPYVRSLTCMVALRLLLFTMKVRQFDIMSMHSHPVPVDPYNPAVTMSSHEHEHEWHGHDADSGRTSSPLVPVRLPVFAAVFWAHHAVIRVIGVMTNTFGIDLDISPFITETYGASYLSGHAGRQRTDTRKKAESMEEGIGYSGSVDFAPDPVGRAMPPSSRVRIGAIRRKIE
jgi:hypothetical protein